MSNGVPIPNSFSVDSNSEGVTLEQKGDAQIYLSLDGLSTVPEHFWTESCWLITSDLFIESFVSSERVSNPCDYLHVGWFLLSDDARYEDIRNKLPKCHVFELDDFLTFFACALKFNKFGPGDFFSKDVTNFFLVRSLYGVVMVVGLCHKYSSYKWEIFTHDHEISNFEDGSIIFSSTINKTRVYPDRIQG